jgi:hypothetical protein
MDGIPIAVCALEWFLPVMRAFVDSESASDRECFTASGEVAHVRLC